MNKTLLQSFDELATKDLVLHHNLFELNLKCSTPRTDEAELCSKLYVIDLLLRQRGVDVQNGKLLNDAE
jgi:hypothetical protein